MAELKSLLESGRQGDCLQAANKLHQQILTKLKENEGKECEALSLLWELIGSKQVTCAKTCGYLLVDLVERGVVQPLPALTQLLAKLSLGYNYIGIIPAISQILALLVKMSVQATGSYKSLHCISSNQHPFISILRSTPKSWDLVLDQFFYLLEHPCAEVKDNALTLLSPVYLYLFCDPNYHIHFAALRSILFKDLIQRSSEDKQYLKLTCDIVSWLPFTQQDSFRESYEYAITFIHFLLDNQLNNHLKERTLLVTSLIVYQVSYGLDCSSSLALLRKCDHLIEDYDVHILILNQALEICSLGSQVEILKYCKETIMKDLVSKYIAGVLVCSLLQCLSFDSSLSSATQTMAEIVRYCLKKKDWKDNPQRPDNLSIKFEPNISTAIHKVKLLKEMDHSAEKRCEWLIKLGGDNEEHAHLSSFLPVVASLFLFAHKTEETEAALSILQKITKVSSSHSSIILTLILHKLASAEKQSSEPDAYLALLKSLPEMATDKNCVSLILKLVGSLACKPHLTPLRLRLLMNLWRQEPRSFQFLHKALEEIPDQTVFTENQIARAMIIKEVVTTHASQYGSDLLSLLSGILNQCTTPAVTLASQLALQSIYILCKESVIDIRTTVKVIAPKCVKDQRVRVVVEYCKILALVPSFRMTGPEFSKFSEECICWLWKSVHSSNADEIRCAAYIALSNYPLEATKLKIIPGFARDGLKLPSAFCATPMDAARKPEDVLPYVPGQCWVNLIAKMTKHENKANITKAKIILLESLLQAEVNDLPKSVYHPAKSMRTENEPVSYNHLPDHSLLRAVISYLLNNKDLPLSPESEESVSRVKLILSLMGKDFGRSLPPLDWLALENFLTRSDLRPELIRIISVQSATSRSAKIILERQMSGELDIETRMVCMQSLEYISCAAPPPALQSFTNKCLEISLKKVVDTEDNSNLVTCFQAVKRCIERPVVPEANKLVLATCIENMFEDFPEDSDIFQEYIDLLCLLPNKSIERLSSPALWWEASTLKLAKAAHLRSRLAIREDSDSPLTWLNELIEALSNCSEDNSFMIRHLVRIIQQIRVKCSKNIVGWLLELMGQISARLRKPGGEESIIFLLDIFNITVVIQTEADSLCVNSYKLNVSRSARQCMLPVSLYTLCQTSPGLAGQLADWSLRLSANKQLPGGFSQCLSESLAVFKYADNWKEAFMWGRIVLNQ